MFFHTDGRTAAAYIACDGDKILHRYHFGLFISGNSGSFFQIDFIINAATELDSWDNHRSEAVKDAYILYHNGGLETDDDEDEEDESDEEDEPQPDRKNVKAHVIVMLPPDIGD